MLSTTCSNALDEVIKQKGFATSNLFYPIIRNDPYRLLLAKANITESTAYDTVISDLRKMNKYDITVGSGTFMFVPKPVKGSDNGNSMQQLASLFATQVKQVFSANGGAPLNATKTCSRFLDKAGLKLLTTSGKTKEAALSDIISTVSKSYNTVLENGEYYYKLKTNVHQPNLTQSFEKLKLDSTKTAASSPSDNNVDKLRQSFDNELREWFKSYPTIQVNVTAKCKKFLRSHDATTITDKAILVPLVPNYIVDVKNNEYYFALKSNSKAHTVDAKPVSVVSVAKANIHGPAITSVSKSQVVVPAELDEKHVKKHSTTQRTLSEVVKHDMSARTRFDGSTLSSTEDLKQFFQVPASTDFRATYSLISDWKNSSFFKDSTLLGTLMENERPLDETAVFLNTYEPFCLVAVGTQGNGKSHTVSCILESCLFPFRGLDVINLQTPMNAVVFHYDINVNYVCESVGVIFPIPGLNDINGVPHHLPLENLTVLVSPQNFYNRNHFYGSYNIKVKPLMFEWKSLTADNIKKIMGIDDTGNQLYMHSLLEILKGYQRRGQDLPEFDDFVTQVMETCTIKGQVGPLEQRLKLLESMIKESKVNAELRNISGDLMSCCMKPGTLVIVDLSDPLLARLEANCIFQVLAEQYCAVPPPSQQSRIGKMLVIDEAHKFMDGVSTDGLSNSIVNIARLMRHDGIRLVVSTQSPKALAPELLELSSVAVMHQFTSKEWFDHLAKKLPLELASFKRIMSLQRGQALVFAKRHAIKSKYCLPEDSETDNNKIDDSSDSSDSDDSSSSDSDDLNSRLFNSCTDGFDYDLSLGTNVFPMIIRQRVTADFGASNCNN